MSQLALYRKYRSQTFSDLEIAHYWGLKPSEFWASSLEDKIYMTAFTQTSFEIRAVEDLETERALAKANRKHGR